LVRLLEQEVGPSGDLLPTVDITAEKNVNIHPYLEWDSNPRSQYSGYARQRDCCEWRLLFSFQEISASDIKNTHTK
jgi:hypothetical protein